MKVCYTNRVISRKETNTMKNSHRINSTMYCEKWYDDNTAFISVGKNLDKTSRLLRQT